MKNISGNIYQHIVKSYVISAIDWTVTDVEAVVVLKGDIDWLKTFRPSDFCNIETKFKYLGNSKLLLIVNDYVEKR